jgi:hypothetical protein
MSPWLLVFLVAAVKIPIAALMLWLPFRSDAKQSDGEAGNSSDDGDGGIKAPQAPPRTPHPRGPLSTPRRRGPHGEPVSPPRVRLPATSRQRVPRQLQHKRRSAHTPRSGPLSATP